MTINGLMNELTRKDDETDRSRPGLMEQQAGTLHQTFYKYTRRVRIRLNMQTDQINILAHQVIKEKKRNTQITLLMELSQQLENQLDQPVAAQLAVSTLERALNCDLACLFIHEPDEKEFMLLAAAGSRPT